MKRKTKSGGRQKKKLVWSTELEQSCEMSHVLKKTRNCSRAAALLIAWEKPREKTFCKLEVSRESRNVQQGYGTQLLVGLRNGTRTRGRPRRNSKVSSAKLKVYLKTEKILCSQISDCGPNVFGEKTSVRRNEQKKKSRHRSIGKKLRWLFTGGWHERRLEIMSPMC